MGQAWPARDGRLALPAREIRPPMGAGTGHPAGAPAHAAGVGPLTLHVVQANLLPAPERRAHAEVLDQWHSLVDIAEIAASAGVRVSVVQASSRQDHLVRNGIEYPFVDVAGSRDAPERSRRFAALLSGRGAAVLHVPGDRKSGGWGKSGSVRG